MALQPIKFDVKLFLSNEDIPRSRRCLLYLMDGLAKVNQSWFKQYGLRPLYEQTSPAIVYQRESTEEWRDIPTVAAAGWGDCEDLACWRIAELRATGIAAGPYIKWRDKPDGTSGRTYHALVRWPDGRIEDPSLALGMRPGFAPRKPVFVEPY